MVKNRSALLCPSCRRLVSRDEAKCPYCGVRRPGGWRRLMVLGRFEDPQSWLRGLIYLNVAMYALLLFFNQKSLGMSLNPLAALAPDNESLLLLGATGTYPIDRLNRWWTVVSASFLHGNLIHIFFNMVALKQIGPLVLREFGAYRTTVIYILGGAIGFWVSYLAGVGFTIGASASVCGLVGAILYYGYSRGGMFGRILLRQVGGWVVVMAVFGLVVPGINNWGHGGGLLGGGLLAFLLGYGDRGRERIWHRVSGIACAAGSVGILLWAIFTAVLIKLT